MEFQAVIMAAGQGSRMYPLTENMPKALLPVGNKPMIWYPIQMLLKAGFEEIFVVVLKSQLEVITKALLSFGTNSKFHYVQISDEDDVVGTADSLRKIKDKVKTDLVVVSCDLITDLELHHLANTHRKYNADLTAFMTVRGEDSNTGERKVKKKKDDTGQSDFIGLDEQNSRLLFFSTEVDVEENLTLKRDLFKRHPKVVIRTDLLDAHLYIVKRWIIDLLVQKKSWTSFKGDALPYLIKKQNVRTALLTKDVHDTTNSQAMLAIDDNAKFRSGISSKSRDVCDLEQLAMGLSSYYKGQSIGHDGEQARCYAYISDLLFGIRANSLHLYNDANHQVIRRLPTLLPEYEDKKLIHPSASVAEKAGVDHDSAVGEGVTIETRSTIKKPVIKKHIHPSASIAEKAGVDHDSAVGEGVTIETRSTIKKSVIGNHCRIMDNVKILNSILMDHITVESGCTIHNSVVCSLVHIQQRCSIKDCQIGYSHTVPESTEANGECLVPEASGMMTLE